jgi:hypothetical protein
VTTPRLRGAIWYIERHESIPCGFLFLCHRLTVIFAFIHCTRIGAPQDERHWTRYVVEPANHDPLANTPERIATTNLELAADGNKMAA